MKRLLILLVSLCFLSGAHAQKGPPARKPQDLLIGSWWSMAGTQRVVLEFAKDGTMKTTVGGQTTNGKYKWLDDSTVQLNGNQQVKVTVSQDELTMVIGSETSKFQREKAAAASSGITNKTSSAPRVTTFQYRADRLGWLQWSA
jgi:hypothetical protein